MKKGARVNTVHDTCHWWETGNYDSFLSATGDVIEIIAKSPHSHYFKDVYDFLKRKFEFQVSASENKTALHRSLDLQGAKLSGTVFIDKDVTVGQNIELRNSIVNAGANVTTSLARQMILQQEAILQHDKKFRSVVLQADVDPS